MILAAAYLGALAWLLLTIPVLVAGLVRLRGSELLAWPWTGAWFAGIALMFPDRELAPLRASGLGM